MAIVTRRSNTIDVGGLTLGEYQTLINPLIEDCDTFIPEPDGKTVCDLKRYAQLLQSIATDLPEDELNAQLLELAELLAQNEKLAAYVAMRDYVGDKIPEQHKYGIDQQQNTDPDDITESTGGDGTPNDIRTFEDDVPELAGPNSVFGRRNWIDLRQ